MRRKIHQGMLLTSASTAAGREVQRLQLRLQRLCACHGTLRFAQVILRTVSQRSLHGTPLTGPDVDCGEIDVGIGVVSNKVLRAWAGQGGAESIGSGKAALAAGATHAVHAGQDSRLLLREDMYIAARQALTAYRLDIASTPGPTPLPSWCPGNPG